MLFDQQARFRGNAAVRSAVDCCRTALLVGLLGVCLAARVSAQDELETVGMAVHTETARDIYVAGLLLPYGAVMQNLMLAPPPKGMEYRIATRRISSRGFSGTILLQAELGSGGRAPESAINALSALKESMTGSLKQGDQFIIYLNEADETVFLLNGVELLRVADGSVFDFFFSGWVGDGAAATIREPLLSGTLDPAVAGRYNQLAPSDDRVAAIAAWSGGAAAATTVAAAVAPAASPAPAAQVTTPAPQASQPAPAPRPTQQVATAKPAVEPEPAARPAQKPAPRPAPKAAPRPTQVAAAKPASETAALDDREYQRQLQLYISEVMRQVYGEVKYPRRAIKYNWEGKVELLARMGADGELIEVTIDSTSGHVGLDKAAQAAVERAAPFPELTPVAREELMSEEGDSYIMAIPVTFALR